MNYGIDRGALPLPRTSRARTHLLRTGAVLPHTLYAINEPGGLFTPAGHIQRLPDVVPQVL